jgi:tRNA threonylcarbamoyladenosine biosynthesis protein TsaB
MAGSVAALEGELVAEMELDSARRTAQTLVPALDVLLRKVAWKPQEVDLVAVTQGPGSFTGLRIGVTTAKTFAYACGAAIVGVNTLAAIARQVPASSGRLWVVMNAERDQLYTAAYEWQESRWHEIKPTCIRDNETWLQSLDRNTLVSGPGLCSLKQRIPTTIPIVPESDWFPRARSVGAEGLQLFHSGQQSDCWSLLPNYFRESAATEKAQNQATGK